MTQSATRSSSRAPAHGDASGRWIRELLRPEIIPSAALLGAALAAWLLALPSVGGDATSAWGLLVSASPLFAASIVLTTFGFIAAVRAKSSALALAASLLLAAILRLTIAIGTSTAFYPWTYKHIAVTQYIGSTGHVDSSVDVYNNWPGLFATTAWVSKLTGVSAYGLAHWFTAALHLGLVLGMYALARQWGATAMLAAAATFLYEGLNFVGQDYFSPQAISIFLALVVLALFGDKLRQSGRGKNGFAAVAAFIFLAIVVTHQLTPFWLLVVIGLLTLVRRCRVWWLLPVAAVSSLGYLALHFTSVRYYGVLSADVVTNVRARVAGTPLSQLRASWYGTDLVYVGAFAVALVLALLALRRHDTAWGVWILAFTPIGLILVQGYGGEAIWRVFLYALPGLCLLFARALVPALSRGPGVLLGMTVLTLALVMVCAQTTFVTWPAYRVTVKELAIVSKVQTEAPFDAIISPLNAGAVNQLTSTYVRRYKFDHGYGSAVLGTTKLNNNFATKADYRGFADFLAAGGKPNRPFYVILSSRVDDYGWQYGQLQHGTLQNLRKAMAADPRWRVVAQNSDAIAFELVR